MSRIFPDWLSAFEEYADDGFVPVQFNTWIGLATLAAALERKVWLPWSETFSYYPNIFVILVSRPGIGKTTAINKGVGLLKELQAKTGTPNMLPNQVTEAKFIELMSASVPFEYRGRQHFQSAGMYVAPEASNSLKAIYGDIIPCFTDFYDCPVYWAKATKKDSETALTNVCLSLLAGSTFDYLAKLVTDENIMGGFASRLIYVVQNEKLVREQKFGTAGGADPKRMQFRAALMQDLSQIHKLVGEVRPSKEFADLWEKWYPEFESKRQDQSEKMQSLLVRTNTNVIKIAILLAASESNGMELKAHHWEKALQLVTTHNDDLPTIFQQAKAQNTTSQGGVNAAILTMFSRANGKGISDKALRASLVMQFGQENGAVERTLNYLEAQGKIIPVSINGGDRFVKWAGDPKAEF